MTFITGPVPIVFIIDDDVSVRESLQLTIGTQGWRSETFASAQAFLARARAVVPSCLVLDLMLPGLNGLELQRILRDRIELPIIFITDFVDVPMTVQAMKAGAVDLLTKPLSDESLLGAIRCALDQSQNKLAHEAELRSLRDRYTSLTAREREVMGLVVSGLLNKQTAAELGVEEITVKTHRGKIMRKMKAASLPELVRMAAALDVPIPPKPVTSHRPDRGGSLRLVARSLGDSARAAWNPSGSDLQKPLANRPCVNASPSGQGAPPKPHAICLLNSRP